jgi:hypothetical protein
LTKRIFSYDGILGLLGALARNNAIFPLDRWSGQAGIILRHDVDMGLEPALALAEREAEIGVAGTFFVLTSAPTYNVLARSSRLALRRLCSLGAEVGLHFDPLVLDAQDQDALEAAARREADILEDAIGQPVRSVSLHNPSVLGRYPLFPAFRNAYDPSIFGPDVYLSDSQMRFRHDPLPFLSREPGRTRQLLLHPLHYSLEGSPYPAAMVQHVERRIEELDALFRVNERYREATGESLGGHVIAGLGSSTGRKAAS